MERKVKVPQVICRKIRECCSSRDILVRVYNRIHIDFPAQYESGRKRRFAGDDRLYREIIRESEGTAIHQWTFLVDDSTSPDDLIIEDVHYLNG